MITINNGTYEFPDTPTDFASASTGLVGIETGPIELALTISQFAAHGIAAIEPDNGGGHHYDGNGIPGKSYSTPEESIVVTQFIRSQLQQVLQAYLQLPVPPEFPSSARSLAYGCSYGTWTTLKVLEECPDCYDGAILFGTANHDLAYGLENVARWAYKLIFGWNDQWVDPNAAYPDRPDDMRSECAYDFSSPLNDCDVYGVLFPVIPVPPKNNDWVGSAPLDYRTEVQPDVESHLEFVPKMVNLLLDAGVDLTCPPNAPTGPAACLDNVMPIPVTQLLAWEKAGQLSDKDIADYAGMEFIRRVIHEPAKRWLPFAIIDPTTHRATDINHGGGWINAGLKLSTGEIEMEERYLNHNNPILQRVQASLSGEDEDYFARLLVAGSGLNAGSVLAAINNNIRKVDQGQAGFQDAQALLEDLKFSGDYHHPILTLTSLYDGEGKVENQAVLRDLMEAAGQGGNLFQLYAPNVTHCAFNAAQIMETVDLLNGWIDGTDPSSQSLPEQFSAPFNGYPGDLTGFVTDYAPPPWPVQVLGPEK